jgi:hypothetical protein
MRLLLDDIDETFGTFGVCDCCQAEGAEEMRREIDDIVKKEQARGNRR